MFAFGSVFDCDCKAAVVARVDDGVSGVGATWGGLRHNVVSVQRNAAGTNGARIAIFRNGREALRLRLAWSVVDKD